MPRFKVVMRAITVIECAVLSFSMAKKSAFQESARIMRTHRANVFAPENMRFAHLGTTLDIGV